MKNMKKKLMLAISSLVLATVLLSTATFAWFTITSSVSVTNMDMTVETVGSIYIRTHEFNFTTLAGNTRLYGTTVSVPAMSSENKAEPVAKYEAIRNHYVTTYAATVTECVSETVVGLDTLAACVEAAATGAPLSLPAAEVGLNHTAANESTVTNGPGSEYDAGEDIFFKLTKANGWANGHDWVYALERETTVDGM